MSRVAELERIRERRTRGSAAQLAAVERFGWPLPTACLVQPTVSLRQAAGTAKGARLVPALRDLFDIDGAPRP